MVKTYVLCCEALKDTAVFRRYYAQMPAKRREKVDKLYFEEQKRQSLGAGILLQKVLGCTAETTVLFAQNGKPYLPGSPQRFNLSHAGEYAVLSVADCEVGCDVEQIKPIAPGVAKQFFAPSEYAHLAAQESEGAYLHTFYRYWTLKESFMKATGLGLQLPTKSFAVELHAVAPTVRQNRFENCYCFKEYALGHEYCLSVCAEGDAQFEEKLNFVTV